MRFRVQRSERYSKAHFPTARVYGPTRRPALRLITCSGAFDRASGHYLDNTVVYAARPDAQRGGTIFTIRSSPRRGNARPSRLLVSA